MAEVSLPLPYAPHVLMPKDEVSLSTFEQIISTHAPVLESLLLQLPTPAILSLYQTSRYLRSFLGEYPTTWNYLSFRRQTLSRRTLRNPSPAGDDSDEISPRPTPAALDQLLLAVALPFGTCLRSLSLDQTSVSGLVLTSAILPLRRGTLEHLSVRECKNVSLKYHIVPYLNLFRLQASARSTNIPFEELRLKSLYTFRCRHHRRRPYLPSSLEGTDSDSLPTHDLIKLCHDLGIYSDSGWCPTPGGRCLRRSSYYSARLIMDTKTEVWVIFDRLWRSNNFIGCPDLKGKHLGCKCQPGHDGQLWHDEDVGYEGEPLGCYGQSKCALDGKPVPTHLRRSHRTFIENYSCYECGDLIQERCEQCSIRMHCMGCRKTLCASCAFAKPLPRTKRLQVEGGDRNLFWWAPGSTISPNLMNQEVSYEISPPPIPQDSASRPSIKTDWCCVKPNFSGSGNISYYGPGINMRDINHLHTAPLPQLQGYEDAELFQLKDINNRNCKLEGGLCEYRQQGFDPMLYWLLLSNGSNSARMCPRNLCKECWDGCGWRGACQSCNEHICIEHDLRGLKARICGYRDLVEECLQLKKDLLKISEENVRRKTEAARRRNEDCMKIRDIIEHLNQHGKLESLQEAIITRLPHSNDDDLCEGDMQMNQTLTMPYVQEKRTSVATSAFATIPFKPGSYNHSIGPLNTLTLWRGCTSFICSESRPMGDSRRRCYTSKRCNQCGVHVCQQCLEKNVPCDCSYCSENYHCPNCSPNHSKECTKAEELERENIAKEAERRRTMAALQERQMADDMAEQMCHFLAAIGGDEVD